MTKTEGVQLITGQLIEEVAAKAAQSPRLRMNHNFHSCAAENPHRFLNILLRDTYVRPHRHLDPAKDETFLVLEGAAAAILFNDAGQITEWHILGAESCQGHVWGMDIAAGLWHTLLPVSARAVCFEVKPGPWDPGTDKDFAPWAPREDDPAKAEYLQQMRRQLGL